MGHTYTRPVWLRDSASFTPVNVSPPGNVPLGAPTIILIEGEGGKEMENDVVMCVCVCVVDLLCLKSTGFF